MESYAASGQLTSLQRGPFCAPIRGPLSMPIDTISWMFFTGAGLALQRLDSDIAEAVMGEMRRRGIVVLPVHDSFLAPASKAAELEAIMVDEAAKFGATVFCSRCVTRELRWLRFFLGQRFGNAGRSI